METTADFLEAGTRCLITMIGLTLLLIALGRFARKFGRSNSQILNTALVITQRLGAILESGLKKAGLLVIDLGQRGLAAYKTTSENTKRIGATTARIARQLIVFLSEFFAGILADLRTLGRGLQKVLAYLGRGLRWLSTQLANLGRLIRRALGWIGDQLSRLGRLIIQLLRWLLIPLIVLGGFIAIVLGWIGLGLKKTGHYFIRLLRQLSIPVARFGRFIGLVMQALGQTAYQLAGRGLKWLGQQITYLLRLLLVPVIGLGRLILSLFRLLGRGLSAAIRYVAVALRRLLLSVAILGRFIGWLLQAVGRGLWWLLMSVLRLAGRGLKWLGQQITYLLRLLLVPVSGLGRLILSLFRLLGRGLGAAIRYVTIAFGRLLIAVAALGRFVGLRLQAVGRSLWRLLMSALQLAGRGLQWLGRQTAHLLRLLLIPVKGLTKLLLSLFQRLGQGVVTIARSAGAGARWLLLLLLSGLARLLVSTFHWTSRGINGLDRAITIVVGRLQGPTARLAKWILSILIMFGAVLKTVLVYVWQLLRRLSIRVLRLGRWFLYGFTAAGRITLSFLMTIVELILIPITSLWRLLRLTLKSAGRALQKLSAYVLTMMLWLSRPFARIGRQMQYVYRLLGSEIRQLIGEQNTERLSNALSFVFVVSLFFGGSVLYNALTTVHIEIWTNDTKASWINAVTETFNEKELKTRSGKTIIVNVEQRDSGDFPVEIEALLEERKNGPTVISPGTIAWVSAADVIWQKSKGQPLVPEECPSLAYAPIGFGMWQSMAEAMGYPDDPIGWRDIVDLAADPQGWARYGHPEWGQFKFGHTDPNSSNTGLTAMTSFVYASLGQTSGLTPDLVRSPQVTAAFGKLELITFHYGSSTRSLNVTTATRGKAYLHAVASSENSILATNYFQHDILDEPLVFIFPKEGAFWSENPFCLVDAPWVTADQQEAAGLYSEYLLSREAQTETVKGWLRPVNLAYLPRTLPDEWQFTDPSITIEDIPPLETDASGETTAAVQEVFNRAKKKATTILVLDTSASMRGDKIRMAKEGLNKFLRQLDEEDEVMVYRFDDSVEIVQPLAQAGSVVDSLSHEIEAIRLPILAQTALHDAVCRAKAVAEAAKLEDEAGEERRLYGIVLLSDGEDTRSNTLESEMFADCLPQSESADVVKVFTIAYGEDAVVDLLERIAERTNGRAFVADPDNIEEVYEAISFEQ